MTDAAIIDSYERTYNIAQAVGADYREPRHTTNARPPHMARHVRGYVLGNKRRKSAGKRISTGTTCKEGGKLFNQLIQLAKQRDGKRRRMC